jgi:hypothetical protein
MKREVADLQACELMMKRICAFQVEVLLLKVLLPSIAQHHHIVPEDRCVAVGQTRLIEPSSLGGGVLKESLNQARTLGDQYL